MKNYRAIKTGFCGLISGIVNGLLGTGGGMLLVPLLQRFRDVNEEDLFPSSVCVMLPICVTSLLAYGLPDPSLMGQAIPYMLGGFLGGVLAWRTGQKIPVKWLHRGFGLLLIFGGVQKLW